MSSIYRYVIYLLGFAIVILYVNLTAYGQDFSRVAEKVMPSVCKVIGKPKIEKKDTENPLGDFLRKQPTREIPHMVAGTCFVVEHGEKKIIITNYHVIDQLTDIKIGFEDSIESYHVMVVNGDAKSDIAVLEYIDSSDYFKSVPALKWGDSDGLHYGESVMAIGHPLSMTFTVSVGIVSHPKRYSNPGYGNVIQTDAAINKGNSGGPLFNSRGEIVGINSFIISPNSGGQVGINFSIGSNAAKRMIAQLDEYGEVRKPMIGMRYVLDLDKGAFIVRQLMVDGPAATAGIQVGDQIYSINGTVLKKENDMALLNDIVGGEPVDMQVLRDNKIINLRVITEIFK